jgi:hypothetical protein
MLLADRTVRRWLLASRLGSATEPLASLALLLAGRAAAGSFAVGALMGAAFQVAVAAAAPLQGRRLDRRALPAGFRAPLLGQAAAALLLAGATARHAPPATLLALAATLGLCAAGLEGGYRALVGACFRPEVRGATYAYDAAFQEAEWLAGPAIVGAVALVAPPWATLLVIAAVAVGAVLATWLLPARPPSPAQATAGPKATPWRTRPAWPMLLTSAALGMTLGAVNAGGPPLLEALGAPAAAWGPLTVLPAAASMAGGIAAARARRARHQPRHALALLTVLSTGMAVAFVAGRSLPVLVAILTLASVSYAPLVGILRHLLERALPERIRAEGFALESALNIAGAGAGAGLLALLLAQVGPRLAVAGIVAAAFAAAAGALLAATGPAVVPLPVNGGDSTGTAEAAK